MLTLKLTVMKPGTIVVCLKANIHPTITGKVKWLPVQDENTPYMIREIGGKIDGNKGVSFEEGVIGYSNSSELLFPLARVREILPAEDIREQIEDMMLVI